MAEWVRTDFHVTGKKGVLDEGYSQIGAFGSFAQR
jgi:hypothetical protein